MLTNAVNWLWLSTPTLIGFPIANSRAAARFPAAMGVGTVVSMTYLLTDPSRIIEAL